MPAIPSSVLTFFVCVCEYVTCTRHFIAFSPHMCMHGLTFEPIYLWEVRGQLGGIGFLLFGLRD